MEELTKEQLDRFAVTGREFIKRYPDHNESLHAAAAQGLDLSPVAVREIIRLNRHDVADYLAGNRSEAHALMGLDENRTRERIHYLARNLDLKGTYRAQVARRNETDEYLQRQREDIRSGKRRK